MSDSNKETKRREKIDKIIFLMGNYYGQSLSEDVVDLFHQLWAEHETEDISTACSLWMKTPGEKNRWFPRANEIIEIIERNKGPKITIQTRAQQQWRVILQQIPKHGMYHPPTWSDPITAQLVQNQFSWSYLCSMEESELQWEQKRWCEAFELAAELYGDLPQIEQMPEDVKSLMEKIKIGETITVVGDGARVPVDKIKAFREMLVEKAEKDEADLDPTNKRLRTRNE